MKPKTHLIGQNLNKSLWRVSVIILLCIVISANAVASSPLYPSTSNYPGGIIETDESVWKDTRKVFPLNTDYEDSEEISEIKTEDCGSQRSISEEAYNGRFSLHLNVLSDDFLPLKTTENYVVVENSGEPMRFFAKTDDTVIVTGKAQGGSQVTFTVFNGKNKNIYESVTQTDTDGTYRFDFLPETQGEYIVNISDEEGSSAAQALLMVGESGSHIQPLIVEDHVVRTNLVNLWVKPKYNAQEISFYVCSESAEENVYIKLLGDKNMDGVFTLGEDFSQGKWQEFRLDLLKTEEEIPDGIAKGLYVKANTDSDWLFDSITSDYLVANDHSADLSLFAKENLEYTEEGLKFKIDPDATTEDTTNYVTTAVTTASQYGINGTLSGISIDVSYGNVLVREKEQVVEEVNLLSREVSSLTETSVWTLNTKAHYTDSEGIGMISFTSGGTAKLNLELPPYDSRYKLSVYTLYGSTSSRMNVILASGYKFNFVPETINGSNRHDIILPPNIGSYIEFNATGDASYIIGIALYKLNDADSDRNRLFSGSKIVDQTIFSDTSFSQLGVDYENLPGIEKKDFQGTNASSVAYSAKASEYVVLKFVNPYHDTDNSNVAFSAGETSYKLLYGEWEYLIKQAAFSQIYISDTNRKVLLTGITKYAAYQSSDFLNLSTVIPAIPGHTSYDALYSSDAELVYYKNSEDFDKLYVYNITKDSVRKVSNDGKTTNWILSGNGRYLAFQADDSNKYIYHYDTDSTSLLTPDMTIRSIDNSGVCHGTYYTGSRHYWVTSADQTNININPSASNNPYSMHVNNSGDYAIFIGPSVSYPTHILKRGSGEWYRHVDVDLFTASGNVKKVVFSRNGNTAYVSLTSGNFAVDMENGTKRNLGISGIIQSMSDDGFLVILNSESSKTYTLFNPVTYEKESITLNANVQKAVFYNSHLNRTIYTNSDNRIAVYSTVSNDSMIKLLLSFDGMSNWYSYWNGKWIHVSSDKEPDYNAFSGYGMTAGEVSGIVSADFAKLYEKGVDILSVGIAARISSKSNQVTPVLKNITLKTVSEQPNRELYASRLIRFDKSNFYAVNGLFPIENFDRQAECYYILYLGDQWIYTYKNGQLIRLSSSAGIMFGDTQENWIEIKQYGMTQKELREMPANVLNRLLVSDLNANNSFGVIYAFKTDDLTTENYTVDLKMQSEKRYDFGSEAILEIVFSDNEVKRFSSPDITKQDIQNFMNWLDARQNNKGGVFYRITANNSTHFINYYMIKNVNISEQ